MAITEKPARKTVKPNLAGQQDQFEVVLWSLFKVLLHDDYQEG